MKQNFLNSFFVIACATLMVLPGCIGGDKKETNKVTAKKSLYVVNVLDEKLYNECHIEGSVNVPFTQVKSWAQTIDKNAEVVMYCANYACTASGIGAKQLIDMGFKKVWAYEAGMHDWFKNGLPSICPVESTYLKRPNIEPEEEAINVPVITTIELKEKMTKHGFFQ